MTENNNQKSRLWQQHLLWGAIAAISVSSVAALTMVMGLTPLKNNADASRLPNSSGSLMSIIPATLKHPINILVLGIDNSGHPHEANFTPAEALSGNSDTMLLVRLQPDTHEINVLSIPRDTLVKIPGVGIDKINDANVRGGPKQAAGTVSKFADNIPIDRYIRVDTEGFIHLVDALGGVEVNVPKKMDYIDKTQKLNIHFNPGTQTLSGQHLEEYVRFRHDALGDIGRVQRQQQVLKDILHTLLMPSSIGKIPKILQVVRDNVDSNLSVEEMLAISHALADSHQMHLMMVPGRFSEKSEYKLSYWISDSKATSKILQRYFGVQKTSSVATPGNATRWQELNIAVANATKEPEAATMVVSYLKKHGFENARTTNHEIDALVDSGQKTQIIAQHGNPDAADAILSTLGTGQIQVASTGDILSDVTIVVGKDLLAKIKP